MRLCVCRFDEIFRLSIIRQIYFLHRTRFEVDKAASICTCSLWKDNDLGPLAPRMCSFVDFFDSVGSGIWIFPLD